MNLTRKLTKTQRKVFTPVMAIIASFLLAVSNFGQQTFRYDVIATSSSSLTTVNAPSINNNGEVAFAGRKSPGGGAVFTDYLPNQPKDLIPNLSNSPQWFVSGQLQINDSRSVLAQWSNFTTTPVQNYLNIVDGKTVNSWMLVAAANGAGQFNDFNEIYPSGLSINNNNRPVFQTRTGNSTTILTAGIRPFFNTQTFVPASGAIFRPVISDNGTTVLKKGTATAAPITAYGLNLNNSTEAPIAQSSDGFTQLGQSPSISRRDEAVAFYGNLTAAGAVTLGTNPGPGIFVSLKLTSGQRKLIRLGGRLIENNPAPNGNDDGICDLGETCIQGELGFNQAGNPIFFNTFDVDSRVDAGYIESGKPGIDDDLVFVSFMGTPNIASDIPGQSFSNQRALWTLTARITADSAGNFIAEKPEKAVKVAQIGDIINNNTLTDITVYDQMANNKEKIAFLGSSANGNMIIRAVVDRTPTIFIPGVGGSELRSSDGTQKLWPPESVSSDLTPLSINNSVKAADVLRKFKTGVYGILEPETSIYAELLDSLKNTGFVEYNLDGDVSRLNDTCGGQNIAELQAKHPTLFVFPYDWRNSNGGNGTDGSTDKLKKYIQCIRAIYPNTDVNLVAHSMGGVLSRRYILENSTDHHVKNLITVGTPWLGAPRAIHALETGSFIGAAFNDGWKKSLEASFGNAVFASQIKQIIEGFPGAHQLLPTSDYFALGGNPLRIDEANYNFAQTVNWLDTRHPNYTPGSAGQLFHSYANSSNNKQDDFRNDTTGVNYYHIYGRQVINKTVGRIEPRLRAVVAGIPGSGGVVAQYTEYYPIAVAGDGTVPIISSSRRIDSTDGLTATCGTVNDKRCIGVCYTDKATDPVTDHNGLTQNPQVQSQILQILKFADGLIAQNPSFETTDCHLPPNNFAPQTPVEAHYISMTGINSVLITDSQGNTNQSISTAYKLKVPEVLETVIGDNSIQVITPTDNTYTMRFTGTGQPIAIEDIRGTTNEFSNASYIVRYDDVMVPNGVITEIKIVNTQVDSLKYDNDGDGIPETVIPASRVITSPQTEDLQAPQISVVWSKPLNPTRVAVTLTDSGSGVKRLFYRFCVRECTANFTVLNQSSFGSNFPTFTSAIEVISEDNAGNRSSIRHFVKP